MKKRMQQVEACSTFHITFTGLRYVCLAELTGRVPLSTSDMTIHA